MTRTLSGPNLLRDNAGALTLSATRTLSHNGLDHLVKLEGVSQKPYRDVAGYWTIGVGHLLTDEELASGEILIAGQMVPWRDGLTEEQVYRLLDQDADWAERAVNHMVTVDLTQNQFDALVSFMFNVGPTNFRKSTLLRELNAGNYSAVPEQMSRWRKAGGKVVKGLVNRRKAEVALWNA